MKVGDLVKVFCTCGESHDEDPIIGVVMDRDEELEMVKVLVNGRWSWMDSAGLALAS